MLKASLNRLNDRQREAALHREGPLLILAGAGSGKTGVITTRIAHLIDSGVPPFNILAVTFTNKAAREMKERVKTMLGEAPNALSVSTFHALCLRILKIDIDKLGYKKNFTLYAKSDQAALIRNIMREVKVNVNYFDEAIFLSAIDRLKNAFIMPEAYVPVDEFGDWIKKTYTLYQKYLKGYNALDFNDLINLTITLFLERAEILNRYQERFVYIMVDEYQDTNAAQYRLISLLAAKRHNLVVVGDDDQSIYAFRGADISNILSFENDYPEAKVIRLEENYRSTSAILNAANALIAKNGARREKKLFSALGEGTLPNVVALPDDRAEAVYVAEDILTKAAVKNVPFTDFAILYRTNAQSRPFEEELRIRGIKYVVVGGFEFYERKEIKDVLCYLKLFVNPEDEVSLLRVINTPRRGVGDGSVAKLNAYSIEKGVSFYDALLLAPKVEGVPERAQKGVIDFITYIQKYQEIFADETLNTIAETVDAFLDEIDYTAELLNTSDSKEKGGKKLENVRSLLDGIAEYQRRAKNPSLKGYLDMIALLNEEEREEEENEEGVALLSIHSAKGLEFPFVYLVGMEDGYMPHFRSTLPEEIEEERRLCYVAVTRAKESLTMTYAMERNRRGHKAETTPSMFLSDIPREYLATGAQTGESAIAPEAGFDFFKKMQEKLASDNGRPG